MKNVFDQNDKKEILNRIDKLNSTSQRLWGKMDIAQMLAHCNVTYELVYEDKHPKPNSFMKLILKLFVKSTVVGDKPYRKNGQTAPAFLIKGERDFNVEKNRLINYINTTHGHGETYFDGKESHSFGALTKTEWNTMFYKHLDHHLKQFGV